MKNYAVMNLSLNDETRETDYLLSEDVTKYENFNFPISMDELPSIIPSELTAIISQ